MIHRFIKKTMYQHIQCSWTVWKMGKWLTHTAFLNNQFCPCMNVGNDRPQVVCISFHTCQPVRLTHILWGYNGTFDNARLTSDLIHNAKGNSLLLIMFVYMYKYNFIMQDYYNKQATICLVATGRYTTDINKDTTT